MTCSKTSATTRPTFRRLRLEPLDPFRAEYAYTNFGLTAAAEAAAAAAPDGRGQIWPTTFYSARSACRRPASGTPTSSRKPTGPRCTSGWVSSGCRSTLGTPTPRPRASGASSNVLDLANWLILQLAGGAWNGNPVIDGDALRQTHLPHALSSLPSTPISRSGFYGFGMNVGYDYAGRLRLSRSADSTRAPRQRRLLPSASLGIVVLTNGMPIGVPESVIAYFLDYVEAGSVQEDWLTGYEQIVFAPMYVNPSVLADQKPPQHPVPAEPDAFYTGTYDNSYYGPMRVVSRRDITAPAHRSRAE